MISTIFRFFTLVFASLCLFSCSDDDDELETPLPVQTLTLSLSKTEIQANGTDSCLFTVKLNDKVLTEGYHIYKDDNEKIDSLYSFSTTQEGNYTFWATYKDLKSKKVNLKATAVDDSKDPVTPPSPGEGLTFTLSKQVIQANGEDVSEFIVKFDGLVLTEGYSIYDENDNKVDNIKSFSTTTTGEYQFWASYKSSSTDLVKVKAIGIPVPTLPADPNPEATNFNKRILLTNFTGTGCQYCPNMTRNITEALNDPVYAEKTIWCVAHTFNQSDPAYLAQCPQLAQAFSVSSYPSVIFDFTYKSNDYNSLNAAAIHDILDQLSAKPANAGVAAKAEIVEDADGKKIALHVAVKAAEEGVYNVGAWLMEDSIKGRQAGLNKVINHNNAVRIADSRAGSRNYTGIELGKIAKGKTAEHVFIMNIEDKWKLENCHLAVFVTQNKEHKIAVTNAVRCPIDGELLFDYAE